MLCVYVMCLFVFSLQSEKGRINDEKWYHKKGKKASEVEYKDSKRLYKERKKEKRCLTAEGDSEKKWEEKM